MIFFCQAIFVVLLFSMIYLKFDNSLSFLPTLPISFAVFPNVPDLYSSFCLFCLHAFPLPIIVSSLFLIPLISNLPFAIPSATFPACLYSIHCHMRVEHIHSCECHRLEYHQPIWFYTYLHENTSNKQRNVQCSTMEYHIIKC